MTAIEARRIAEKKKVSLAEIEAAIKMMAEAGKCFAIFLIREVENPETYSKELDSRGFTVEISKNHFQVTW